MISGRPDSLELTYRKDEFPTLSEQAEAADLFNARVTRELDEKEERRRAFDRDVAEIIASGGREALRNLVTTRQGWMLLLGVGTVLTNMSVLVDNAHAAGLDHSVAHGGIGDHHSMDSHVILGPDYSDGGHENANAIVTGFEPADNFGLAQVIVGGERVEGDPGADMAVRAVLKDLNIPLASVKAQTYRPVTYWLRGGGRMLTDSTGAFHGDDFPSHDTHFYSVQNTETGELAIVMGQDAAGRATALSDATSHLDGDLHVTWIDGVTNNPDGSVDLSANGHLLMNVAGTGERQELALYVPWGTDENGQPRIHTIHARVAGGVRGPIIEPTPGTPRVELPPITLVTSREQMYQNPESLPDGSTAEKRKEIAVTILQMYKDGQIPNFGPDVSPYIPTRERINESANKFQSFFIPENSADWGDVNKRPIMGVTLVNGGDGVYYAVQLVKQEGTDVPGLIWYQVSTPENSGYELDRLFNRVPGSMVFSMLVKGPGCNEAMGKQLCEQYLNPDVVAAQTNAVNEFIVTHQIPSEMTDGEIIFLMLRGQIGV